MAWTVWHRWRQLAVLACLAMPSVTIAQDMPGDVPEIAPVETTELPNRTIPADDSSGGMQAETAPVLTVDQDRLYNESAWGMSAAAALDAESDKIATENERLVQQLSEEEAELTDLRETLDPAEFRKRAEAFDARATGIRRERAQVLQRLTARAEADRQAFFKAAFPIIGEVMQRRDAVAVLDHRTVLLSLETIDITSELIAELDKRIGEGPPLDRLNAEGQAAPE